MRVRPNTLPIVLGALLCASAHAMAVDPRYPEWPCQQLKVPEISITSVWSGPLVGNDKSQVEDPQISDLAARLAARRTSMDEAQKLIADFVAGSPEVRQSRATSLFAALFSILNGERGQVMSGLERFSRKEKEMAEDIRQKTQKMQSLQDAPDGDRAEADRLANQLLWETRIFEDRRTSMSYVCEVPVLIEKRLFDLSRLIQAAEQVEPPVAR
jgi:hypothetical protein